MAWTTQDIIGFDTETTGVDVATDRIVTAALVTRSSLSGLPRERSWLIDPGVPIPEAASAIHGVTTEHARRHGRPPAEALEEIAAALAGALALGHPVVAFNAGFDLTLLEHELTRNGLATLHERLERAPEPVIDPLVVDRGMDRYRRGKRTLGELATFYGVTTGDLHAADVDVTATLDVLRAIVARYPELAEISLSSLHRWQAEAHRVWAESFNEWLSSRGYERPGADIAWPCTGAFAGPPARLGAPPAQVQAAISRTRRAG